MSDRQWASNQWVHHPNGFSDWFVLLDWDTSEPPFAKSVPVQVVIYDGTENCTLGSLDALSSEVDWRKVINFRFKNSGYACLKASIAASYFRPLDGRSETMTKLMQILDYVEYERRARSSLDGQTPQQEDTALETQHMRDADWAVLCRGRQQLSGADVTGPTPPETKSSNESGVDGITGGFLSMAGQYIKGLPPGLRKGNCKCLGERERSGSVDDPDTGQTPEDTTAHLGGGAGYRGDDATCRKQTSEADPFGKHPHEPGAKMDAGKAPVRRGLLEQFPRACLAVAQVTASGALKYTWGGWLTVLDGVNRYGDAECRHICKAAIEGPVDKDYGHLHAAHEAWNALARLELMLRESELIDPPTT